MGEVDLSTILKSHKFDEMNVDTKLAKRYLETNKAGFRGNCSSETENLECTLDSYGNKIYCDDQKISHCKSEQKYYYKPPPIKTEQLKELAIEIEKETDLFCQLEYLIRRKPICVTKNVINLIVGYLHHLSENTAVHSLKNIVLLHDSTPLLTLGNACQLLTTEDFTLVASKETAVICYLFYQHCRKVGFNFNFSIGDNLQFEATISYAYLRDTLLTQITGVITERSDLDSAVDAFLNSDCHLIPNTRIVVEESIYQEFKNVMAWKCKSKENKSGNIDNTFKSKCTEFYNYNNKHFLVDFAGNVEEVKNEVKDAVIVEAYRTTNELLSLINKSTKRHCVSLWASGVSEANEIAFNIDVPFIWINDYCNFNGPNEVSRVLFQEILINPLEACEELIANLMQKQKVWWQKSFTERCASVLKVMNTVDQELGTWFADEIPNLKLNNFVSVMNNTMIMGFYKLCGSIFGFAQDDYINALRALVNGSAIVISEWNVILEPVIFKKLAESDFPVAVIANNDFKSKLLTKSLKRAHTKIIWTNFGTKFAN